MSSALFKVVAFLELEKRDPLWHCAEIISFTFMICLEDSGGFLFFFFFNLTFFVHGEAGLFVFTKELCLWLCSLGVI